MTQARKHIFSVDHAGTSHCVSRCVRLSWLCGFDRYLQKSLDHREPRVERRIALNKLGLNPEHWSHRVKGFGFALALGATGARANVRGREAEGWVGLRS